MGGISELILKQVVKSLPKNKFYRLVLPDAIKSYNKYGVITQEGSGSLYKVPMFSKNKPSDYRMLFLRPGDVWVVSKDNPDLKWLVTETKFWTPIYNGKDNSAPISYFDFYQYNPSQGGYSKLSDLNISETPNVDYLRKLSKEQQVEYLVLHGLNDQWLWTLDHNPKHLEVALRAAVLKHEGGKLPTKRLIRKGQLGLLSKLSRLTPKLWTLALDAAIASGDLVKALKLRDLHFLTKAPKTVVIKEGNPMPVYHGSPVRNITEFDASKSTRKAIGSLDSKKSASMNFFSSDEVVPEAYIEDPMTRTLGKVYSTYLNVERPMIVDYEGRNWDGTGIEAYFRRPLLSKDFHPLKGEHTYFASESDAIKEMRNRFPNAGNLTDDNFNMIQNNISPVNVTVEKAINSGNYDGAIIRNVGEAGQGSPVGTLVVDDYVTFQSPSQIKSADAVTYDDNGVRIPLGERDNFNINDIRYGLLPLIPFFVAGLQKTKKLK